MTMMPVPWAKVCFPIFSVYEATAEGEAAASSGPAGAALLVGGNVIETTDDTVATDDQNRAAQKSTLTTSVSDLDPIAAGLIPEQSSTGAEAVDEALAQDEQDQKITDLLDEDLLHLLT